MAAPTYRKLFIIALAVGEDDMLVHDGLHDVGHDVDQGGDDVFILTLGVSEQ